MVEQSLLQKLNRIFAFKRTTFNAPNEEAIEQETLFVNIQEARAGIKEGKEVYRITGQAFAVSTSNKYAIGYFAKRIKHAERDDTKDLFFYEFEENVPFFQNLVRRGFSFVYFFSGDYDPDHGTITSIEYIEGAP